MSENYCFIYSGKLSSVREGRLNLIPVAPFDWNGKITRKEQADSPPTNIGWESNTLNRNLLVPGASRRVRGRGLPQEWTQIGPGIKDALVPPYKAEKDHTFPK